MYYLMATMLVIPTMGKKLLVKMNIVAFLKPQNLPFLIPSVIDLKAWGLNLVKMNWDLAEIFKKLLQIWWVLKILTLAWIT